MYEIDGKRVYTELVELVEPSHTALIVIDMQKDFCSRDGSFANQGLDLSVYESMVPRLAKLLDAARSFGVTVIHLQMTTLPGHRVESPAQIRFNMLQRPVGGTEPVSVVYTVEGTEGHQIIPELSPIASEFIVPKYRSSGFWGTNLDMILGSNGLETVIVTGCTTEGCVEFDRAGCSVQRLLRRRGGGLRRERSSRATRGLARAYAKALRRGDLRRHLRGLAGALVWLSWWRSTYDCVRTGLRRPGCRRTSSEPADAGVDSGRRE